MKFSEFLEIQARVQPQNRTDAWTLLCEVRRLGDLLAEAGQMTNLGETAWSPADLAALAQSRLEQIYRLAQRRFEPE